MIKKVPHLTSFCIFFDNAPVLNPSVKLMQISSLATDIWLFYDFADLAAKCLFPPIFGSFLGV